MVVKSFEDLHPMREFDFYLALSLYYFALDMNGHHFDSYLSITRAV